MDMSPTDDDLCRADLLALISAEEGRSETEARLKGPTEEERKAMADAFEKQFYAPSYVNVAGAIMSGLQFVSRIRSLILSSGKGPSVGREWIIKFLQSDYQTNLAMLRSKGVTVIEEK
jgi:hypothetical protein